MCSEWICFFFFFFKQKTAYELRISDWSSDVCSSDLAYVSAMAKMLEGWVEGRLGRAGGVSAVEAGLDTFRETGAEIVVPFFQKIGRASCRERVCQYV